MQDKEAYPEFLTVDLLVNDPRYPWLTKSALRHYIFAAEDRSNSKGEVLPGNGLAPAIARVGRKLLISVEKFDAWIQRHCVSEEE